MRGFVQDFSDVDNALGLALPVEAAIDMRHTACVARYNPMRIAGLDVGDLALHHCGRDLGMLSRKDAPKAAAFLPVWKIDDLGCAHGFQQGKGLFPDPQIAR